MYSGKRDAAGGRVSPSLLVQGALAACLVLLALVWSNSRGPAAPPQPQQYVTGLTLNVDVGRLPRQVRRRRCRRRRQLHVLRSALVFFPAPLCALIVRCTGHWI